MAPPAPPGTTGLGNIQKETDSQKVLDPKFDRNMWKDCEEHPFSLGVYLLT